MYTIRPFFQNETSQLLKARQYCAAALTETTVFALSLISILLWGDLSFLVQGQKITLGFLLGLVSGLILIFSIISWCSALFNYWGWVQKGRPKSEDDQNGLLSDWKSGERSPLRLSFFFLGCAALLFFALIFI